MKWLKTRCIIPLGLLFSLAAFSFTSNNLIAYAEEPEYFEYWVIGESDTLEIVPALFSRFTHM